MSQTGLRHWDNVLDHDIMIICLFEAEPHHWKCPHSDFGGLSSWLTLKNRRPSVQKPPSPHHVLASLPLNSRLWWSVDWRKPVVFSLCMTASAPTQLPLCLWNSTHPVVLPSHSAAGFFLVAVFVQCQSPGAVFAFYGNVWIEHRAKYVYIFNHSKSQTSI